MNRNHDLTLRFPNASHAFLVANGLVASPLPDALTQSTSREEPLDTHQAQERGQGRTLVCITRFGTKLLDADNLSGGTKPLVDALRYAKLIPNDDPGSIQLIVAQKKVRKDQTGTQVLIIPNP